MLYLNDTDIYQALTPDDVLDSVEEALRIYEARSFSMPERLAMATGGSNQLLLMPCAAEDHMVTKLVSVYPGNRARGKPVIDGIVVLYDRATAEILALLDGKTVTAMRTGAVTGVSIRYLAREDAVSVGLVGCGVQGFYQLLYACAVRDIATIVLYDIDPLAVVALTERLRASPITAAIEVADSPDALARSSDVLITATTARQPVFPNDPELFVGKHCVAIGSFEPDVREYPDALFTLLDKVWVDLDFAKEESGELIVPLRKGLLREDQIETLGHLIASGRPPARGRHGTTFSKSVGMALFDLTTARRAYLNAIEAGLGAELPS
ncbi:MAG: ornithine cyclodeaminase family protein [Anaerolineae bacterium]|nr:ornithine cyclodeaminase family protein [Anaerolineae bacterium]